MSGEDLKAALARCGLSQYKFAALTGVSTTALWRWTSDRGVAPLWVGWSLEMYERLSAGEE